MSIFVNYLSSPGDCKKYCSNIGSCDHFNAVREVYINFEPYQMRKEGKKHYRYPGLFPFEVGWVNHQGVTWLDAVGI